MLRLNRLAVHCDRALSVEYGRPAKGRFFIVLSKGQNQMRETMNAYKALVTVQYHSGEISTWVTVNAENFYMAKVLLERLYGEGRVLSPVMDID